MGKCADGMDENTASVNTDDYCLQARHVVQAWNICSQKEDYDAVTYYIPLVNCLLILPENIAMSLISTIRESLTANPVKAVMFFCDLVYRQRVGRAEITALTAEVQLEVKRAMFSTRARVGSICKWQEQKQDLFEGWMTLETFRRDGDTPVNQTPRVSLIERKSRLIQVSVPIESETGEFYAEIRLVASRDEVSEECTLMTIGMDVIEQFLKAKSSWANVETVLPEEGRWSISTQARLLGKGVNEALRSDKAVVELNTGMDKSPEQPVRPSEAAIDSLDELARQNAGDIQGTIRKLHGVCSKEMDSVARYSLLHTGVTRGRATLNEVKHLAEANGDDEDFVPGIAALTDALAEAHLPMRKLEAALKLRNKKDRVKGFKVRFS